MPGPPARPKIYHILHADRLRSVAQDGCLWSDAKMIKRQGAGTTIGMGKIKERRLALPVKCYRSGLVGEYVPFYFCSRSVMLYVIHKGNHEELAYRGGQEPIVHLECDLRESVAWAEENERRWAFSLSNAGAHYAEFRKDLVDLDEINWDAVTSTDFRSADVREGKQAEFLMHESFPWELVSRIGVKSMKIKTIVDAALRQAEHRPKVEIMPGWYF